MARLTQSQNAQAGPSQPQSQRRTNGFGGTQFSTQDDEVLQKPAVQEEEDEEPDPRLQWNIDTFENVPVASQKLIGFVGDATGAVGLTISFAH